MRQTTGFALVPGLVALALLAGPAAAQNEAVEPPQRYPSEGIAILDCAPPSPAPEASCVLRVPPGHGRETPRAEARGDGAEPAFRLVGAGRNGFPDGLDMSVTLVLIDLSPGPQGGRRRTFETEKALIGEFVANLPATEPVAIYGFNQRLELLQDFTTDHGALRDTVSGLELAGTNTRIATFVSDAVSILAERDDAVLRNIVLISDGQEEGREPVAEVVGAAIDAGVVVSALGSFWRPVGSEETGAGMDFLESLARDTSGISGQAILRQEEAASAAVARFGADYADALRNSGLIMPQGEPTDAVISLVLREPVKGQAGAYRDSEISVSYLPNGIPQETPAPVEPEPTIFGLTPLYVYIGGGFLALLVLLGVALGLMRRGGEDQPPEAELDEDIAPPAPPAPPPAQAYLVLADSDRRIAIAAPHVNVGRGGMNEIVIEDESISRLHAQIHRNRDGGFSITDMDSLNGTFVNGDRVRGTMALRPGDTVAFGRVATRLTPA